MAVDVFPALDLPVIYIAQPYGGTDPSQMEIDLPNTVGILRPGMYATVRIPVSRPETATLPTSSVFLQGDQAWVGRFVANKAVRTSVWLGLRD